jgi:hypothetical protein
VTIFGDSMASSTRKTQKQTEERERPAPPIFSLSDINRETFSRLVGSLQLVDEEVTLHVEPEKIWLREMDPSHILLLETNLKSPHLQVTRPGSIVIKSEELQKLTKEGYWFSMQVTEADPEKVNVQAKSTVNKLFSIPVISLEGSAAALPKVAFTNSFSISRLLLEEILGSINEVSDDVTIFSNHEGVSFSARSEANSVNIPLNRDAAGLALLNAPQEVKATYRTDMIAQFLKLVKPLTVNVMYTSKMPIKIDAAFKEETFEGTPGVEEEYSLWLAPRTE